MLLRRFGPEIWIADGTEVSTGGFHYGTRTAVIRLADRGLFVWSPIKLTEQLRYEIEVLGDVHHLVPPNSLHHLFLNDWRRAYPDARIWAPPRLRNKRKDIDFAGDLADAPNAAWATDIDQVILRGNLITTEVVFFHRRSATVLFTDLIQQFPPGWFTGWRAIVARVDLMVGEEPAVPRKFRHTFVNRGAARTALARIRAWPAQRLLMAHGTPVERDGQALISRAFGWLTG
jgi:Domain of unknown function (DUF4336)